MIKSIYSSKLYVTSSRKDRIHAALMAPGNFGLVQQLAEDLDEEYSTPENLGTAKQEVSSEPAEDMNDVFDDNEEIDPEKDLMTVDDLVKPSSAPSHSSNPMPSKPTEHNSEDRPEPDDTNELIPESPANEKPAKEEKPVEESTQILSTTIIKPEEKVNLDVLKGSLNGRDDTTGVSRIAEKENEVWIYYNDDVNLNNIMTDVIEYISNADFNALEFNRLARSDNAIVFELVKQTVSRPNKQMEDSAE